MKTDDNIRTNDELVRIAFSGYGIGDQEGDTGRYNICGKFQPGTGGNPPKFKIKIISLDDPLSVDTSKFISMTYGLELWLEDGELNGVFDDCEPVGTPVNLTISEDSDDIKISLATDIFRPEILPQQPAFIGINDARDNVASPNFIAGDLFQDCEEEESKHFFIHFEADAANPDDGVLHFSTAANAKYLKQNNGTLCAKRYLKVPFWGCDFDNAPKSC